MRVVDIELIRLHFYPECFGVSCSVLLFRLLKQDPAVLNKWVAVQPFYLFGFQINSGGNKFMIGAFGKFYAIPQTVQK